MLKLEKVDRNGSTWGGSITITLHGGDLIALLRDVRSAQWAWAEGPNAKFAKSDGLCSGWREDTDRNLDELERIFKEVYPKE